MQTVVLVEDEYIIALATEQELRRAGYHVVAVAHNIEQAREAVRKFQPEVVLLDLKLGRNQNGLDLLPEIKQTGSRVLVLSSNSDPDARRRARMGGADGFLNKPLNIGQLNSKFRQAA